MWSGNFAPRKKKRKVSKKEKDGNAEVVFYFWRFSVLFREDGIFLEDMTLWDANKGWVWMNEKLKCILFKCTMVPPRPSLATKCRMNYVTRYYGPFTVVAVVAVAFNIIIWNIIYRVASECLSKITVSRWQCSMCISRRARLSIWMVRRPICRLRDCVPLLSISFVSVDSCVCFFGSLLFHIFNCTLHFVCHRKITFCSESLNHRSFLLIIYSIEWYAVPATRIAHEMVCKCVSCVCLTQNWGEKEKNCIFWFHIYVLFGDKWMSCSCVYFMADARWNNREFIGFTLIVPTSLQFPSVCLSRWSSVFGVWTVIKVPNKLHVIIAWMSGRLATYA